MKKKKTSVILTGIILLTILIVPSFSASAQEEKCETQNSDHMEKPTAEERRLAAMEALRACHDKDCIKKVVREFSYRNR